MTLSQKLSYIYSLLSFQLSLNDYLVKANLDIHSFKNLSLGMDVEFSIKYFNFLSLLLKSKINISFLLSTQNKIL